jgi:hypothetical protein
MFPYKAISYHPANMLSARRMPLGQLTPGQEKAVAIGGSLLSGAFSGATAWVGIWTGQRATGFLSVLGWVIGIGGAIGAGLSLIEAALLATGTIPVPPLPAPRAAAPV